VQDDLVNNNFKLQTFNLFEIECLMSFLNAFLVLRTKRVIFIGDIYFFARFILNLTLGSKFYFPFFKMLYNFYKFAYTLLLYIVSNSCSKASPELQI
jgi:hypothetical protein